MSDVPDSVVKCRGLLRGLLIAVGVFNTVSAIGGGIGLLTPGSMGMPPSLIQDSVFTSFLWPALLLIIVIGGSQLVAVIAELRISHLALFWAAFAGFAMIIWIFVELAVMHDFSILHCVYFSTGVLQLVLVLALAGVLPAVAAGPNQTGLRTPDAA